MTKSKMSVKDQNRGTARSAATSSKQTSSLPDKYATFEDANARLGENHVFFWGGVLSNWYLGSKFSGARCFELFLPELESTSEAESAEDNGIEIEYPGVGAFSTRLIKDHMFNCGEQWMMAMKAWFFERDVGLSGLVVEDELEYRRLKERMYLAKAPGEWAMESREMATWKSSLCQILMNKKPSDQKQLGRQVKDLDDHIWAAINIGCVAAACIARAEADAKLKKVYLSSGKRGFVEGSPRDVIWGVGIHWKQPAIDDPANWIGENRLGQCHDIAARRIKEMCNNGTFRSSK